MIDVHHHLLYGLDDGPESIEESIAMAQMARADGITHVVCTPHASHRYKFQPEENAIRLGRIREELKKLGSDLVLGQGCDFHLTWDNIEDAKENPGKYTINGKRYLLVELPDHIVPMGLSNTFTEFQLAGVTPIVTHPERNYAIQRNPAQLKPWLENGVLVQVTAGAVTGKFGNKAQSLAHQFLTDDWVHVIATDAHGTSRRSPKMREAYEVITAKYGRSMAERLCVVNPQAIFAGNKLEAQPYPRGIDDEKEYRPKVSWFLKIFR